jgi:hypothetical protein
MGFRVIDNTIIADMAYLSSNIHDSDVIIKHFFQTNDSVLCRYNTFNYVFDMSSLSISDFQHIANIKTVITALQNKYSRQMECLYLKGVNEYLFDAVIWFIHPNIVKKIKRII